MTGKHFFTGIKKNVSTVTLTALLLFMTVNGIYAQAGLHSPVNLGMGGGGTAYIDSYHSNFVNPANLMLNHDVRPSVSIGLPGAFSMSAGGSLANIDVYNRYLTRGLTVRDQVATDMMDEWFGQDLSHFRSLDMDISHIAVGAAVRQDTWSVSIAFRNRLMADIELNRGAAELFMLGLDSDIFGDGRPVNFNAETTAFSELSFGMAGILRGTPGSTGREPVIYAGIAPKIIMGHHSSGFTFASNLTVQASDDLLNARIIHDFNYRIETAGKLADQLEEYYVERRIEENDVSPSDFIDPQGSDFYRLQSIGLGLDAGATMELTLDESYLDWPMLRGTKKLRIGLSVNDLGVLKFGSRSGVFQADGIVDWQGSDFDQETIDREFDGSTEDYLESVLVDSIGSDIYGNFFPEQGGRVAKSLPGSVNAGVHLSSGRLGLAFDLGKGFNNRGTNSRRIYASFGSEYKFFGFWPVRAGVKTGGYTSTSIHFGTGLEFKNFEFSLAASTVPRSTRYGSGASIAWSGLVFHF